MPTRTYKFTAENDGEFTGATISEDGKAVTVNFLRFSTNSTTDLLLRVDTDEYAIEGYVITKNRTTLYLIVECNGDDEDKFQQRTFLSLMSKEEPSINPTQPSQQESMEYQSCYTYG